MRALARVAAALLLAFGLSACTDDDDGDGGGTNDVGADTGDATGGDAGGDDTTDDTADDAGGDDTGGGDTTDASPIDGGDDDTTDDASTGPFDLAFAGTAYAPHNDQTLYVALIDAETDEILETDQTVVTDGTFSFEWDGALEAGKSYFLDYFADLSENGFCDTPPTDHGWRESIDNVGDDVDIDVVHNVDFFDDVCMSFPDLTPTRWDLSFSGTAYDPHNGQMLYVAIVEDSSGTIVAEDSVEVTDGSFSFTFEDMLIDGETYHVDYFADFSENELCDAPPTDHGWRDTLSEVSEDQTLEVTHDTDFYDMVCSSFPELTLTTYDLSFSGTAYAPHNGQTLWVAIIDQMSGETIATDMTTVADGTFSFTWEGLLTEGRSYYLDYAADLSEDGFCDMPPTDHGWRVDISEVMGDVTVEEVHDTDFFADVCDSLPDATRSSYDLSFSGTAYAPHNGQTLWVAIIDQMSGETIATDMTTVADGTFSFTWEDVLTEGRSYYLDYAADLSEDGFCDMPPTDHGWRVEITDVSEDQTIEEVHDTDFYADVCDSLPHAAPESFDLTLSGTGYDPHNDQMLWVSVYHGSELIGSDSTMVAGGTFSFTWDDLLTEGEDYTIYYAADLSENGFCDAPPTDHGWRVEIADVSEDQTIEEVHDTDFFADVCDFLPDAARGLFDLSLSGTAYSPHNGQPLWVAIVNQTSGDIIAIDETTVTDGTFSFMWEELLLEGESYFVDYAADLSENGFCDMPPTDHGWRVMVNDVSEDQTIEEVHDTDFYNDVCDSLPHKKAGSFDLTFSGTDYDPHNGQDLSVAIIEQRTGAVVATDETIVMSSTFSFSWMDVLAEGESYYLDWYADLEDNDSCDDPPTDHGWREMIMDVSADESVTHMHDTDFFDDVCASF